MARLNLTPDDVVHGWGWPAAARKMHYFVGPVSLCRKWLYTGYRGSEPDQALHESWACMTCSRKIMRELGLE